PPWSAGCSSPGDDPPEPPLIRARAPAADRPSVLVVTATKTDERSWCQQAPPAVLLTAARLPGRGADRCEDRGVSVSAEAPLAPDPDGRAGSAASGGSDGRDGGKAQPRPTRPLVVTGVIAALAAAASGLAVLVTLTAICWITAPHVGIGAGLGGVLRTAAMLWLVAHHVGFTVRGAGRIGLLPLGLVLLPGALLAMAGRWVVRVGNVTRLRHVGYAGIAP